MVTERTDLVWIWQPTHQPDRGFQRASRADHTRLAGVPKLDQLANSLISILKNSPKPLIMWLESCLKITMPIPEIVRLKPIFSPCRIGI